MVIKQLSLWDELKRQEKRAERANRKEHERAKDTEQNLRAAREWHNKSTPFLHRPHSYRAYHAYDHDHDAFYEGAFRALRIGIPISIWQFVYWKEIDLQWAEHQITLCEIQQMRKANNCD